MSSDDSTPEQGPDEEVIELEGDDEIEAGDASIIAGLITDSKFKDWYSRYQFAENIRNGTPYFNGPSKLKPPGEFSATDLLKCHRKIYYKHRNAPEENRDPEGIFYFGTQFEEDLAEQYLEDSVPLPGTFLRNSLWMKTTIDSEIGEISLTGSTDPAIVDENGRPILLSEVKTSSSIEHTKEPKEHHLAQAHAYLQGLSEQFDRPVRDVVFLYAERDTLDVKTFHETFDEWFWENRVIDWMRRNTYYRVFGFLPPADPEQEWECEFCPYRGRCGQTSAPYGDEDAAGFLPLNEYPREKVVDYLEAHEAAQLTPSLAQNFPELAEKYGAFDWQCDACGESFDWAEISYDGVHPPECPMCGFGSKDEGLRGPPPEDQHHIEVVDTPGGES